MVMNLEYLVFYTGNLKYGFNYVYTKKINGHAFYIKRTPFSKISDIADKKFDFYNPHFNKKTHKPFIKHYKEKFINLTDRWDRFSITSLNLIQDWKLEYTSPFNFKTSQNNEWGVRFKTTKLLKEKIIFGINSYPKNFGQFKKYLKSFI